MNLVTLLATYIMVWWILFFMALPWGLGKSKALVGFTPGIEPGTDPWVDPGAPERPFLRLKVVVVSFVTALICLVLHVTADLWGALLRAWLQHG
ncbi:MAG: DUF1467 family protein [Alphaproteobacteria bacterium]